MLRGFATTDLRGGTFGNYKHTCGGKPVETSYVLISTGSRAKSHSTIDRFSPESAVQAVCKPQFSQSSGDTWAHSTEDAFSSVA